MHTFFAAFIPLSAIFAEKFGRKTTSIGVCAAAIFGLFFSSKVLDKQKEVNIPFEVLTKHTGKLILGTVAAICTFVVFYLTTVFALNWGTTKLGYARGEFLELQLFATLLRRIHSFIGYFCRKIWSKNNFYWRLYCAAIFGLFFL